MKLLIYFLRFIHVFIEFLVFYLVLAFVLPLITISKEINQPKEVEVFILTNGVHTDIVVPVKNNLFNWNKKIEYTGIADSSYKYLAMGWGDKGFYLDTPTWAELKTSVALKAAFGINSTAIHATYYKQMKINEQCKNMWLSNNQYNRLIHYISNSFKTNKNGEFIKVITDVHYGDTDAFYEAKGRYNLFKTCNTWANNALYACGQKCCFWTPLDKGIFMKY